jgi:hypothetical protein
MFRAVFWVVLVRTASIITDDGGSTHLWNVGLQSFYTAVQPRRQLWTLEVFFKILSAFRLIFTCDWLHPRNCLFLEYSKLAHPPSQVFCSNTADYLSLFHNNCCVTFINIYKQKFSRLIFRPGHYFQILWFPYLMDAQLWQFQFETLIT